MTHLNEVTFMNNLWQNAVGSDVTGHDHDGTAFHGVVTEKRAKYGTDLQFTVVDNDTGDTFFVDASELYEGVRNLHIYL